MRIVYLFLAYNDWDLLSRTVRRLDDGNNGFLIHVQKSVDIEKFKKNIPNEYFISEKDRIETIWGDYSCVEAELLLFRKAIEKYGEKDNQFVLMSGSCYPIKSNKYIYDYFSSCSPVNFFAFCSFTEMQGDFKKMCFSNRDNYWLSFSNTKCKIEIKPFNFIRIRCVRKISEIPFLKIFKMLPRIVYLFFLPKKLGKYKELKWCVSETWMELSSVSVKKVLDYIDENPGVSKIGLYLHNPEEILIQTILNTIELDVPRRNYLVCCESRKIHGGDLSIRNSDIDFVKDCINNPNFLYLRKFNSNENMELLDYIDSITEKE